MQADCIYLWRQLNFDGINALLKSELRLIFIIKKVSITKKGTVFFTVLADDVSCCFCFGGKNIR